MNNRYEIREKIGEGAFGVTYKAWDSILNREVAIKRLTLQSGPNETEHGGFSDFLFAEASVLSTLNHPNIVTVFDVGQDEDGGFFVMELIRGETFEEAFSHGAVTQIDFIEIVFQTMEALIAASEKNLLHRDLKPDNLMVQWRMLSRKFQIKILDFGLAKFVSPSSASESAGVFYGQPFFMAPETIEWILAPETIERKAPTFASDLYSMGVIYYYSLAGSYPFKGDTDGEVIAAHLDHELIPLDQLRPDIRPEICEWVMWLINRNPVDRPQTPQEALKRFPRGL